MPWLRLSAHVRTTLAIVMTLTLIAVDAITTIPVADLEENVAATVIVAVPAPVPVPVAVSA